VPSLETVKQFRQEMFSQSMALIDKKGADYNREQQLSGDTLFNLKVAEILGIVSTAARGSLVRLSDQFMRLISRMQQGVHCTRTMNNPFAEADRLARMTPRGEPFAVPAPLFDFIENELGHVRVWDDEQQRMVEVNYRFTSPDEDRAHLMFRGRIMLRGD
jgi:hypothetical protein